MARITTVTFILTLTLLTWCCLNSDAQKDTLYFDREGKWFEGYPSLLNNKNTVAWKFAEGVDKRVYNKLKESYDTMKIALDNDLTIKNFLLRHPGLFRVFSNVTDLGTLDNDTNNIILNFKDYGKKLISYFDALKLSGNFATARQTVTSDHFPDFPSRWSESFTVSSKNQYGEEIGINNNSLQANENIESISFSVFRDIKDNRVIGRHYKHSFPKYRDITLFALQEQAQLTEKNAPAFSKIEKEIQKWEFYKGTGETAKADSVFNNQLLPQKRFLNNYLAELDRLQQYILQENREWIKSWLWFSEWEPLINPLSLRGFTSDSRMSDLKLLIDSTKDNIGFLTKYIENDKVRRFSSFNELKMASDRLSSMNVSIRSYEAELKKLQNDKAVYEKGLTALKTDKQLAHYGELFFGKPETLKYMRFHNYSRNLELMNTSAPGYICDEDMEKIIAVNVPKGIKISLVDNIENYTPQSAFSAAVDPVLDALLATIKGNLGDLQQQAKNLSGLKNKIDEKGNDIAQLSDQKISVLKNEKESNNETKLQLDSYNAALNQDKQEMENKQKESQALIKEENKKIAKINGILNGNNIMSEDKKNQYKEDLEISSNNKKRYEEAIKRSNNQIAETDKKVRINKLVLDSLRFRNTEIDESIRLINKKMSDEINSATEPFQLEFLYQSIKYLNKWFLSQAPPIKPYELSPSDDTLFSSYAVGPKTAIPPGNKKNTYTLYKRKGVDKEEKIAEWEYMKYALTTIDPIAGPVFTFAPRSSVIYDPATQTFSTTDLGRSDIMLGIKFYPFKVWIEDKKFFGGPLKNGNLKRGKSFVNRIAIAGGVGVQQSPLRNFFAGFSYDIITGFAVNYGWNFYTKKDYTLKNGVIEKEFEGFTNTTYWGITISPVTLLKMLKIINVKP